jgi:aminotransferase
MAASFLGILDEGDEVVVFEPFYESYNPDAILSGATGRYVTLYPPDWRFDPDELSEAFGPRTRAIVVNSPHNPTGKVFTPEELGMIAALCREHDAIAITDEIYEHITYEDREHVPIATLPGMRERTVTISALSKTYSVTGWRVGWAVAPPPLMAGIRSTHDFLTVAAAAPLQLAGVAALGLPGEYYQQIRKEYAERRDLMLEVLAVAGFTADPPEGAYYVMADVTSLGFDDDVAAARHLVEDKGVATVPGSSFFSRPELGRHLLRFAFCKKLETLEAAAERLRSTRSLAVRLRLRFACGILATWRSRSWRPTSCRNCSRRCPLHWPATRMRRVATRALGTGWCCCWSDQRAGRRRVPSRSWTVCR